MPNLDLDDGDDLFSRQQLNSPERIITFVDRVLSLRDQSRNITKFRLHSFEDLSDVVILGGIKGETVLFSYLIFLTVWSCNNPKGKDKQFQVQWKSIHMAL